jgi:hypothetical protein
MTEKIIVEIRSPALSKCYEFRISKKLNAGKGLEKIISEIRLFEHNEKIFPEEIAAVLFSKERNFVLNKEMSFSENGIRSGDTLLIL